MYLRDLSELRAIDLATKADRSLATGAFGDAIDSPRATLSPDGHWIALFAIGEKHFTNVHLVPFAADATPRVLQPVSFLANVYANTIAWGRDGIVPAFRHHAANREWPARARRPDASHAEIPRRRSSGICSTSRRDQEPPPATPARQACPAPANPAPAVHGYTVDTRTRLRRLRQRLSLVPTGVDVQANFISPDGKTAVLIAAAAGQPNLYTWSLDELAATAASRGS